jgi:putative hydrolase
VLHTEREDRHYTVLFSNTARAHQLARVTDWVVIHYHTDHDAEGQRTVVTETGGPLEGERVVRGREAECHDHYETQGRRSAALNEPVEAASRS